MQIELLYFDDCPNWRSTLNDLKSILNAQGLEEAVSLIRVPDNESAQVLRFPGSPTVRINGRDIEADAPESGFNLECRIYWSEGRASGTPSNELLTHAINGASNDGRAT